MKDNEINELIKAIQSFRKEQLNAFVAEMRSILSKEAPPNAPWDALFIGGQRSGEKLNLIDPQNTIYIPTVQQRRPSIFMAGEAFNPFESQIAAETYRIRYRDRKTHRCTYVLRSGLC